MVDRWGNSLFSWDNMVARSLVYGGQTVTQALYEASGAAIQQAGDGSLYFLDGMGSPSLVRLQNGRAQTVAENVLDFRVNGDWVIYTQGPLSSQEDISTTAVMAYDGRHAPGGDGGDGFSGFLLFLSLHLSEKMGSYERGCG